MSSTSSHRKSDAEPPRSPEDCTTWYRALDRIQGAMESSTWHLASYSYAFQWLLQFRSFPPTLKAINRWLRPTDWRVSYVDGYVPANFYREMHAQRIFPVARQMRPLRDLEYSVVPDFFHDVVGHLPMLFYRDYRILIEEWGNRSRKALPTVADRELAESMQVMMIERAGIHRDTSREAVIAERVRAAQRTVEREQSRFHRFDTFYTWAIEFGVFKDASGSRRLTGGAALSSPGEMHRIFTGAVLLRNFASGAIGHSVDYTQYQPVLFEVENFSTYFHALATI